MDTIIYFYKKHGLTKPVIDSHQMKGYLLVRVGMNVGENQWFTHSLSPSLESTAAQGLTGKQGASKPLREQGVQEAEEMKETLPHGFTLERFLQRLREYKKKLGKARAVKQRRKFFEEEHALVCQELETFLSELNHFVDQRYDCRCVYGDAVRKGLMFPDAFDSEQPGALLQGNCQGKEDVIPAFWLPQLWRQYWQIPEFNAYLQPRWVELLLENAMLHHFVVLGCADAAPAVILGCARRMKSLRWILQEQDYTEELHGFVDDFYGDYGLAVTLQPLEGGRAFARLLLVSKEPVCVLDFTGESHISSGGVAKGSIWIDFFSVEEKARRVLERQEGISYFSLKEIWKRTDKP